MRVPFFQNFPQLYVIDTVKSLSAINEAHTASIQCMTTVELQISITKAVK